MGCWEGTACLPLVSQGPLTFHAGGSAMSTGMVAPSEMQPLTSRRRWTWPKPPLMKGSEICMGAADQKEKQLVLVAPQLLSTPQPGPGQAAVTSYPTVGPRKRQWQDKWQQEC